MLIFPEAARGTALTLSPTRTYIVLQIVRLSHWYEAEVRRGSVINRLPPSFPLGDNHMTLVKCLKASTSQKKVRSPYSYYPIPLVLFAQKDAEIHFNSEVLCWKGQRCNMVFQIWHFVIDSSSSCCAFIHLVVWASYITGGGWRSYRIANVHNNSRSRKNELRKHRVTWF